MFRSGMLAVLIMLMSMELAVKVEAQAGKLASAEVDALREIARELGKKDWDFKVDPCSNHSSWRNPEIDPRKLYNNTLFCNCSFPGDVCHVVSLYLKGQDLPGVLPPSLVKLPHIKVIDFTRNYLNGTIPPEWTSTKLENLSVAVNRLSGPIPDYLANITTLLSLSLESNMFSGPIPPSLGKLANLEKLTNSEQMKSPRMIGIIPEYNHVTDLVYPLMTTAIGSNNFTGRIPDMFQNWKQLEELEIQASGFEGPIPPSISSLTSLNELRISDLNGGTSQFPSLRNMKGLQKLMLRDCNISGQIPDYFSELPLRIIDLSFNKLVEIGQGFTSSQLEKMYLTNNSLSGPIPDWIKKLDSRSEVDLSYNNFSEDSVPPNCRETLQLSECLQNHPCSKDKYSAYINCGGKKTTVGHIDYEADYDQGGETKYVPTGSNWEVSSTGHFWDTQISSTDYIAHNVSVLKMNDSDLYTTARLSPLSLTYYIRCLGNGNYTVKLHFAEIVIRDNRSFHSLGRRVFDVYIQGTRILKDFNIESTIKGVDKAYIHELKAVRVRDKTLEIRFKWAGKGTAAAPKRGTYGPLISAISVKSEFTPPDDRKKKIIIVVGAVVLFLILVLMILGVLWWKGLLWDRISREEELRGLDLKTGVFTLRQIKAATDNFDAANKIGEGGFGSVYKGILLDGTIIAVKKLSPRSKQGNREFVNEIGMISVQPTLLQNRKKSITCFVLYANNWYRGSSAEIGLANKAEDLYWYCKRGYMAPEYALWGYLTYKADVYSFGVVALEIVAGKNNMKYRPDENFVCLLDWALVLQQKGNLLELVDPKLNTKFDKEEAIRIIKVALLCTNTSPALRPTMSGVVSMLEGHVDVHEIIRESSSYGDDMRFKSLTDFDQIILQRSGPHSLIQSSDSIYIGSSSTSTHNL
ncbi:hypothetical protein V6N13_078153 [Hibiscus sabdariffa]